MAFADVRGFLYQNPTSGREWNVMFRQNDNGTVDFRAQQLGVNRVTSDPDYDNTEVTGVVVTTQVGRVFGPNAWGDTALAAGAYYDASNRAGAGALLSTLLA